MTNRISKLKYDNAEPMRDIYYEYSKSKLYKSFYFRMRSKIQFYRYSFISKVKFVFTIKDIGFIAAGYLFSNLDLIKNLLFRKN